MPLLLSHGWPGSVFEFLELIPRLTDPARFGGDPADAFTVVAPSLPGYGLSFAPGQPRFGVEAIADCLRRADDRRARLSSASPRRAATGARSSPSRLGYAHAERLIGIHLNLLPVRRDPTMRGRPDAGGAPLPRRARHLAEGGDRLPVDPGHAAADARLRPDRLAGRARRVDRREVPRLDRLRRRRRVACSPRTSCSPTSALYWFTGAIGSSFWPYYARMHGPWPIPEGATVDVPTGLLPSSRARSCARRARWPSAPTPTSGAGA